MQNIIFLITPVFSVEIIRNNFNLFDSKKHFWLL